MASIKSLRNDYDFLIAGSDLSALLLAKYLVGAGRRVAVLEASDLIGGINRPVTTQAGRLPADLGLFPATDHAQNLIRWAAHLAEIQYEVEVIECSPVTFDEGQLKPFAGFGDRKFKGLDELSHYNLAHQLWLKPGVDSWVEKLSAELSAHIFTRKEVTLIQATDSFVTGYEINGDELWTAEKFVFCPTPHTLVSLLSADAIDSKHRQRLAKSTSWTAVTLHFTHSQIVTDNFAYHFLMGGGHDFEPLVGRFFKPYDGHQDSVWLTLIPAEQSDDNEFIGHTIRNMKKQIKRPYHLALENLANEKITVAADSHGHMSLRSKEHYGFSELPNLWLGSHLLSELRGPLGFLEVAMGLCQSAGLKESLTIGPAAVPPEVSTI